MENHTKIDFDNLADYRWFPNGQSAFSGNLLKLYHQLDQFFISLAKECSAQEHLFPTFISARELERLEYFRSFPHLVTFPVFLNPEEKNLKSFAEAEPISAAGEVQLTTPGPIRDVLTPAACYHFYIQFQGQNLEKPKYLTTRGNCFRRESHYRPLERQWNFSMREIVCIGTADEVKVFLDNYRQKLEHLFTKIKLPINWDEATDPFFNPLQNPKYLAQKLAPVKTEMVFNNSFAIGSVNFHRNYFGETFQIERDGQEAFSGCVAFGIERWIFAFLTEFGTDETNWSHLKLEQIANV